MGKGLAPKQQRFVREYLVDLNATQAAIRAGYSERTAKAIGSEVLGRPAVAAAIAAAQAKRAERTEIDADWVVEKLRANVAAAAADKQFAAVNGALAILAKHTGGFVERTDLTTGGQPLPPTQIAVVLVKK